MKNKILISILLISLMCFSLATDYYEDKELEKIIDFTDNVNQIYDIETGKINTSMIDFGKSKAQERIDLVNDWLNENVSWLRFIFRMTPQISILFFLDFLFILWGLVHLILNAGSYWESEHPIYNYLIGTGVFLILLFSNVPYFFAKFGIYLIDFVSKFTKYTVVATIIVLILLVIVGVFFPKLFIFLAKGFKGKKDEKFARKGQAKIEEAIQTAENVQRTLGNIR